jgi:hypothetical protein
LKKLSKKPLNNGNNLEVDLEVDLVDLEVDLVDLEVDLVDLEVEVVVKVIDHEDQDVNLLLKYGSRKHC